MAAQSFGGPEPIREASRDARGVRWLEELTRSVRYGSRQLAGSPVTTVAAALSLAVGIAVAASAFSLVNSLLFRPLPVADPDRVLFVHSSVEQGYPYGRSAYADAGDYGGVGVFSGVVAWRVLRPTLTALESPPARLGAAFVTPGFFDVLGVRLAAGRPAAAGAAYELVISADHARRLAGSARQAMGRRVAVNGVTFTVVGVAPPSFRRFDAYSDVAVWIPADLMDAVSAGRGSLHDRSARDWQVMARLAPGVSAAAAESRLAGMAAALAEAYPDGWRLRDGTPRRISVVTPRQRVLADSSTAEVLGLLSVMVALILLLSCTNAAGVLLAHSVKRRHEIAVRMALGASRRQLGTQLFIESLLLAALAGIAGLLLARATLSAVAMTPLLQRFDLSMDWRVFGAAAALSLACAVLFGTTPMREALRVDVRSGLSGAGTVSQRPGVRGRLVALQVCLSCLLVLVGVHASRGFLARVHTGSGAMAADLLAARLDLVAPGADSAQRRQYLAEVTAVMRSLPGVLNTTLAAVPPTSRDGLVGGYVTTRAGTMPVSVYRVDADYFETLDLPLLAGDVPRHAAAHERSTVVINRALARVAGADPGSTLQFGGNEATVAAIVDDAVPGTRAAPPTPTLYDIRFDWSGMPEVLLLARTLPGADVDVAARFLPVVRDRYPERIAPSLSSVRAQLEAHFAPQRYVARMALGIGVLQLLLAALGLYSLLLHAALARTRELGVRMALGSGTHRAAVAVMKEGLHFAAVGAALGVTLGVPASIFAARAFTGADPLDPVPFAAALLAVAAATVTAALVPLRRAARIEPMAALRHE